ncbi:hypothetical protein E2P81_ATG08204 [Venturia nashicola]|uniref:Uncharacterized protein n=1 Tax=Venturia nashicola TaxID=86259 RepID=A0A4Z1NHR1_9PEZI|nr:hypothetical protein E6O75_ATG08386 [Venturia nashicola]TLD21616.1 hypothetical protein E2P81_ATG08204 [Venturia nashicola]
MGTTISTPLNHPRTTHPTALPLYPSKNLTLIPTCSHDLRHSPHDYTIVQNGQVQQLQLGRERLKQAQYMQRNNNASNVSSRSSGNLGVEPPRYVAVPSRGSAGGRNMNMNMMNTGGGGMGMGMGGPNARYKYVGPGMYWDTWQTSAPPPAYQARPGPRGMGGDVICGYCGTSGEVGCVHMNNPQNQRQQNFQGGGGTGGNDILQALRGLMGNNGGNGFMNGGHGNGCGQSCTANDGGVRVKGNWGHEDVNLRVGGKERCPCDEHGGCENASHGRNQRNQNQNRNSRRRSHRHNYSEDGDSDTSSSSSCHRGRGRRRSEREKERERAKKEEEWRRPFRDVGERLGWTAADMEQINTGASNLNKSTAPRPAMDIGDGSGGPMDGMGLDMGPMGPMGGGGMGMGGGMNDAMGGLPPFSRPRRPRRPRMRPDAYGPDAYGPDGLDEGFGGLGDARGFGPPDDFEGGPGFGGLGFDDDDFGGGFGRGRRPGGGRLGKRGRRKGIGGRLPRRGREGPDFEDYAAPEMSGALGRGGANDDDAWEEVDAQPTPPASPKKRPSPKAKSPEPLAKPPSRRSKSPEWEDVKTPPPSRRNGGPKSRHHHKSPARSKSPDWESIKSPPPPPASRGMKSPRTRPPSARPAWMERGFYPLQQNQGQYLFPPGQMGYGPPRHSGYAPPFAHEVPDVEDQRAPPPGSQHPGQGQPPPPPGSVHPHAQPPTGSCPPPPPGSYRPPQPGW